MKRILLLTIFTILFSGWVFGTHTLTDGEVIVTGGYITSCSYGFADKSIIIPETLDGQTVIGIADAPSSIYGVFYREGITSVQLPSTIEYIGTNAFRDNNLTSLNLSACTSLKEIAQFAFFDNQITSVNITGCTALMLITDAFGANSSLSSFALPTNTIYAAYGWRDDNGTTYSGGDAVTNMRGVYRVAAPYTLTDDDVVVNAGVIESCSYHFLLADITIPETLDGQMVTGIGDSVFMGRDIYSLVLPTTLQTIGINAFSGNSFNTNLSSCTSLVSIGEYAFSGNELTGFNLSEFPLLASIGKGAFRNNQLTAVDLSGNTLITSIPDEVFEYNDIQSVNLSGCSSLLQIGYRAFYGNEISIANLNGCSLMEKIGENAFANNSFSSFTLPTNTTHAALGWKDTDGNSYTGGQTVNELYTIYRIPITYTLTDADVEVTAGIITSSTGAYPYSDIIIPSALDGQTVIGTADATNATSGVFYGQDITSIQLPSTMQTLGDYSFYDNLLVDIDITHCTSLINIGYRAFSSNPTNGFTLPIVSGYEQYGWNDGDGNSYMGGDFITDVDNYYKAGIPYTLTDEDVAVHNGIIDSCYYDFSLTNIIIPDTLDGQAIIGIVKNEDYDVVFAYKNITSVQLPTTLEFIGYSAFYDNNLQSIDLSVCPLLDSIGDYAFDSNILDSIDLSNSSLLRSIGEYAFSGNNIFDLDFSACSALEFIGYEAFYDNEFTTLSFAGCTALEIIDEYAFSDNSNLSQIDLSACTSLYYIGEDAFNYGSLSSFALPTNSIYSALGWRDGDGNTYSGGETVTDIDTYYKIPIQYTLTNDDVIVENGIIKNCSYHYEFTDIIIPETLDGQTIVGIADTTNSSYGVFAYSGITSVQFPSSLEFVGAYAFYDHSIIGSLDFSTCPNLTSINNQAFYSGNISLDSVSFSGCSNISTIGSLAFGYNSITGVDFSGCTSLIEIGEYAFQYNDIINLNLTGCSALKSIKKYAFRSSKMITLDFTDCTSLSTIGEYAFGYVTTLSSANINMSGCTSLTQIGYNAFYGSSGGFALPTPDITGYLLDYWLAGTGLHHEGGETVTNTSTTYVAQLVSAYTATFNVSDGVSPIESVTIDLDGYTPKVTDINGQAVFTVAVDDSIAYTATSSNYLPVTDSISVTDTVVIENVILTPCYTTSLLNETICEGESVNVGDSSYSTSGTFITTLVGENQYGCDSIVTLNLTVNPVNSIDLTESICEGDVYYVGDSSYSETGIFVTSLQNQLGCDSTVNLNLTVIPNDFTELNDTIAGGETVTIGDTSYSETGTHVTVLTNQFGCDSTVTLNLLVDETNPVAICQPTTLYLDESGSTNLDPLSIDGGSSDNLGSVTLEVSHSAFDCTHIGENTISLFVTDLVGLHDTCVAVVTVADTISPIAICQDIDAYLDASGDIQISAEDINNISTDNCAIATLVLDNNTFTCSHIGTNTVVLTATDSSNNFSNCTAQVTIYDTISPVAICQPIDVYLDANGEVSITADSIDAGSFKACEGLTKSIDISTFDCTAVGSNTVTLTIEAENGKKAQCTSHVNVHDTIKPIVTCQDITIFIDTSECNTVLTIDDIKESASDNCSVQSESLSKSIFNCTDTGSVQAIELIVEDVNGNTGTGISMVTIEALTDTTPPVAVCQTATLYLDESGMVTLQAEAIDGGSYDDYPEISLEVSEAQFNCDDFGTNPAWLIVTDAAGHIDSCETTVTITDTISPIATCQDIDVYLDSTGSAEITATELDNGSFDNCGVASLSLDITTLNCDNLGANMVTLNVVDNNSNSSECAATVTVYDTISPKLECQDITIFVDTVNCYTLLTPDDIKVSSSDNCNIHSEKLSKSEFDCSDTATVQQVSLTATDQSGNQVTMYSNVTIEAEYCSYALSKTSQNFNAESQTGSFNVISETGCNWEAISSCGWISISSGNSGSGNGTVQFKLQSNESLESRTCNILVAGETFKITQYGIDCTYSLNKLKQDFDDNGGKGSVTVNTHSVCEWNANSSCDWVSLETTTGKGTQSISFNVDPNTELQDRSCLITISGKLFTVTQKAMQRTEADIISFSIEGQVGETILKDSTIVVNMSYKTDLSRLVPKITVSPGATISPNSGIETNFSDPVSYLVTSEDGANTKIWTANISDLPYIYSSDTVVINELLMIFPELDSLNYEEYIDVVEGLIVGLNLSNLNLYGSLPDILWQLDSLKYLDISNNNLSGWLPNIFGRIDQNLKDALIEDKLTLEYLDISNNRFVFSDIEDTWENLIKIQEFKYSPQAYIGKEIDTTIANGSDCLLEIEGYTAEMHDQYQWFKNGTALNESNSVTLEFEKITYADSGTYTCQIINTLVTGLTLHSKPITISVSTPVGISEQQKAMLKIYPNPASAKVMIETGINRPVLLSILNIEGKQQIQVKEFTTSEIDISNLAKGVYLIRIADKNNIVTKRLIVK